MEGISGIKKIKSLIPSLTRCVYAKTMSVWKLTAIVKLTGLAQTKLPKT